MIELLVSRSARRRLLAVASVTLLVHTAANVAVAAAADHLVVDTVSDTVDVNPGDGLCADAANRCSLRAAMQESEQLAGHDTITFAVGDGTIIVLDDSLGPLPDVTEQLTIDATTDPAYVAAGRPAIEVDATGSTTDPVLSIDAAGSTVSGLILLGGSQGVAVTADDVTLRHMVIGSAIGEGVFVDRAARPVIADSWIGIGPDGVTVPNAGDGIRLGKFVADGQVTDNIIAGNGGAGVGLVPNAASGNSIVDNMISDNATQAIDLNTNDRVDTGGGSGPNDLQSFPVITAADHDAGSLDVTFTLDGPAGIYRIDLYAVTSPDPGTSHGELETHLSTFTFTSDGSGSALTTTVAVPETAVTDWVSGTATQCIGDCATLGSTSEAGPTVAVVAVVAVTTTTTSSTTTTSTTSTTAPSTTSTTAPSTTAPSTTTTTVSATSTTSDVTPTTSASTSATSTTTTSTTSTTATSAPTTTTPPATQPATSTPPTADVAPASDIGDAPDDLAFANDQAGANSDAATAETREATIDAAAVQKSAAALLNGSPNPDATSAADSDDASESGLLKLLLAIAEMVQNARPPLWPYYMAAMLLISLELLAWSVVPRQRYFIADHAFDVTLGGRPVRAGSGPYWGRTHHRGAAAVTIESPSGGVDQVAKSNIASHR